MKLFVHWYGIILTGLILLVIALLLIFPQPENCRPAEGVFPGGFTKPDIALELVGSGDDLQKMIGDDLNNDCRTELRQHLRFDNFVFIPIYWLLFVSLSWILMHSAQANAFRLGGAAAVLTTVAAICDLVENHYIAVALNTPVSALAKTPADYLADHLADSIRLPALCKWMLLFIAVAVLATLFLRTRDWTLLIGILFLLSSVITFSGLYYRPAIEKAMIPLCPALILMAVLFTFFTDKFIKHLPKTIRN